MKNNIKAMGTIMAMVFMVLCKQTILSTQAASVAKIETPEGKQFATITKKQINKNKVKKGDTLQYSFTIKDNGIENIDEYIEDFFGSCKEFRQVQLIWESPKKQAIKKIYSKAYNEKTKTFKISDKIKISKGMQQGRWKLSSILIYSDGGEDSESVALYNSNMKWEKYMYLDNINEFVDLSFADFTVRGTGKKVDKEGPTISAKSLKLSKKVLKKGTKSKFSVKVKDQSGMIRSVTCDWMFYGKKYDKYGEEYSLEMKYDKKKKVYECKIPVSLWEKKAKLKRIVLEDYYGNKRTYYWDDGVREYWSNKIMDDVKRKEEKESIGSWGKDFNGKLKTYSLKKKDKKVFNSMVITRMKKYIKKT